MGCLLPAIDARRGGRVAAVLIGLMIAVFAPGSRSTSWGADDSEAFSPQSLVDSEVDITLSTGETLSAVQILKVREGNRKTASVLAVTITDKTTGKPNVLGAVRIREICKPGGGPLLVYDMAHRALVEPSHVTAKVKPDEQGDSSVRLALSDDQQHAAVEKQRAFLKDASERIANHGMQLHETKRFLFYTDVPAQIVTSTYVPSLDTMYAKLCSLYGIDPNINIWKGKASVVVFVDRPSFLGFQKTYFSAIPFETVAGVANLRDGEVIIAAQAGTNPKMLATVLVHETTHGFTYRYFGNKPVPSWLHEGLAESIAYQVVGGSSSIQRKVDMAIGLMRQSHRMGGDFFTAAHIKPEQYGMATSFVNFLVAFNPPPPSASASNAGAKLNSKPNCKTTSKLHHLEPTTTCFRRFIEKFRSGACWENSLHEAYGLTLPELTERFGQSIGVANLRP